jgi:23S rRNA pseudouridine2605 synthase
LPPPKHKRSTDEIFSEPQRLHKVLASCGFGSRRAMEEMILAGRITVNRMPAEVGQKVGPGDEVRINGELVKVRFTEPRARVLMYHKPAGELVTRDDPEGRPTVFEKLPSIGTGKWINVGRLDYNTEGLLLFTNSGELANRLMHPRYEVEREYAVRIMGRLSDEQMQALTSGVQLDDGPARCEKVSDAGGDDDGSNHWYHVVLKEGRNREVRRLFEALGLMVSRLIRTRYGMVAMPSHLKRGNLAELEPAEANALVSSAGLRSGSAPGKPEQRDRGPGRHDARKGAPSQGKRPPHRPGQPKPHGAGKGHPQGAHSGPRAAEARTSHARGGPTGNAFDNTRPPRTGGPRPANQRGPRPPQKFAERPGQEHPPRAKARGHGARPAKPPRTTKHNFDEVQPQSNANASPFGRTTLSAPRGAPRGLGPEAGPSQRSGPRAQKVAHGKVNGSGPTIAYAKNRGRRLGELPDASDAPARTQRTLKRPAGVHGKVRIAVKNDVDSNVAPPSEPRLPGEDDT